MNTTAKRRALVVLLVLTLGLLVADLSDAPVAARVRDAAGATLGPVQRAIAGTHADEVSELAADNARLRAALDTEQHEVSGLLALRRLLDSDVAGAHRFVAARVLATEVSPLGGRSVTLDVGTRDGVSPDSTVIAAAGLVGRVRSVSPWTCDVQVLGSFQSVVAVRVGAASLLGTVGPLSTSDRASRPPGSLTLTVAGLGMPRVGDSVATLGSPGGRPYAPGIHVGTVTAVDPVGGASTSTATVRPAVDPDTLDVVGVLVALPRVTARPASDPTGAAR